MFQAGTESIIKISTKVLESVSVASLVTRNARVLCIPFRIAYASHYEALLLVYFLHPQRIHTKD